jgi:hypothetical protein
MENPKEERNILVLDSGAIIRCGSLAHFKDAELFSIEEVLNEIKDVNARNALASSPIQIQTKIPTPDALKAGISTFLFYKPFSERFFKKNWRLQQFVTYRSQSVGTYIYVGKGS